jgi:hypothetical protein
LENRRTEVTGPIDHMGGDPNRLAWLETFDKPPYSERTKQLRREIIKASEMAKPDSRAVMGLALIRDGQQNDTLGKLSRYEAALLNAVDRTLRQLFVTQNTRISREPEQIVVTPRGASKK